MSSRAPAVGDGHSEERVNTVPYDVRSLRLRGEGLAWHRFRRQCVVCASARANLLERVVVVDHGRVVIDAEAEDVRGTAYTVVGPVGPVAEFVGRREVVARQDAGAYASATVRGRVQDPDRRLADELSLDLTPVSLQELVAHATTVLADGTRPTQGADR